MRRREFLSVSVAAGLLSHAEMVVDADAAVSTQRDYYELRSYVVESQAQRDSLDAFFQKAAIPAFNRQGIGPVGVFYPLEELSPVYVLLRHKSPESVAMATKRLLADNEFLKAGAACLDTPPAEAAYKRMQSSLMVAFEGIPTIEIPTSKPGRIFQLRTYESHSVKAGQKKIEMFNIGELAVFRKTGLQPVFFGETLLGDRMPNLTYMLAFDSMEAGKEAWKRFGADPDWQKLRAIPEYADAKIVSHITNLYLKPAAYSQI